MKIRVIAIMIKQIIVIFSILKDGQQFYAKAWLKLGAPFSGTECIPNKHYDDLQPKVTKIC